MKFPFPVPSLRLIATSHHFRDMTSINLLAWHCSCGEFGRMVRCCQPGISIVIFRSHLRIMGGVSDVGGRVVRENIALCFAVFTGRVSHLYRAEICVLFCERGNDKYGYRLYLDCSLLLVLLPGKHSHLVFFSVKLEFTVLVSVDLSQKIVGVHWNRRFSFYGKL